jgi:hypothetical protein
MDCMTYYLGALRTGHVDFTRFAAETAQDWTRLAHYVMRRQRRCRPGWHDLDDVRQDLLTGAWIAVERYDPSRGASLKGHVIYTACDRAKKALAKAARARQRGPGDCYASRHDLSFAELVRPFEGESVEEAAERLLDGLRTQPTLDGAIEEGEARDRAEAALAHARGDREKRVLAHLVSARSFEAGVEDLYDDAEARHVLRLGSEMHAIVAARRVVRDVAARLGVLPPSSARRCA